MSLVSVVNMVYAQVPSATASGDVVSVFFPWDRDGASSDIIERVEGDSGAFDVVVTALPVDDGAASVSAPRWRATVAVRVWYARGTEYDRKLLQGAIATDAASIVARINNPNNWATAEDLDALMSAGAPAVQLLHQGAAALVTIPFTAIYYEG